MAGSAKKYSELFWLAKKETVSALSLSNVPNPLIPFGGKYRLIDFALSNFINSQIFSIYVPTQFKSQSLAKHLQENWRFGSILRDHFNLPVPAQKRTRNSWYKDTADAIY
tara:strand:+ start:610 stop:939 length:330 start_codon:yes stop_codon:yes gene_type:complete